MPTLENTHKPQRGPPHSSRSSSPPFHFLPSQQHPDPRAPLKSSSDLWAPGLAVTAEDLPRAQPAASTSAKENGGPAPATGGAEKARSDPASTKITNMAADEKGFCKLFYEKDCGGQELVRLLWPGLHLREDQPAEWASITCYDELGF